MNTERLTEHLKGVDADGYATCPKCGNKTIKWPCWYCDPINADRCKGGCGIDFAEFPEMRHTEDECPGPECTCYELIGGHQPGCYFYGRSQA